MRPLKLSTKMPQWLASLAIVLVVASASSRLVAETESPPVTIQKARDQLKTLEVLDASYDQVYGRQPESAPKPGRPAPSNLSPNLRHLDADIHEKRTTLKALVDQARSDLQRAEAAEQKAAMQPAWKGVERSELKDFAIQRSRAYRLIEDITGPTFTEDLQRIEAGEKPHRFPLIRDNVRQTEEGMRDVLGAVGKLMASKSAELGKDHPQVRLLEAQFDRLSTMTEQRTEMDKRARTAKTEVEAAFYNTVTRSMENSFNQVAAGVAGIKAVLPRLGEPPPEAAERGIVGAFNRPLMEQQRLIADWQHDAARDTDVEQVLEGARESFGEGRAGAGGISLHAPVAWRDEPAQAAIHRAVVENGRLVLLGPETRLVLPPLDLEYLALAMRSILGREGVIRGKLVADEPGLVVLQTGSAHFGELCWKKEFLPEPWNSVAVGSEVDLSLGPGFGMLSQPEPSIDRITYYGPLQNTRMGRTLYEADAVLLTLLYGVDARTSRPVPLPEIDGMMFGIERTVRLELEGTPPSAAAAPTAAKPPPWWHEGTWFVWVPNRFVLAAGVDGSVEFAEANMKLVAWSGEASNVSEAEQQLAEHATAHFAQLADAYPVLHELVEVAKAVAVVRWLHQRGVSADLEWAAGCPLQATETPENVRRLVVVPVRGDDGKPILKPPPP